MTEPEFTITSDDPTSTANSHQAKHLKTIRNSAYGSKCVGQQELFMKLVENHAESDATAYAAFNGRDYEWVQDSLYDAMKHVRRHGASKDDYSWYVHPETFDKISDLYNFHSREPMRKLSSMTILGTAFIRSPQMPEGWVLLADLGHTGYQDLQHGTSAPMALVREADVGFRDDVPMDCGGRMRFRVINA